MHAGVNHKANVVLSELMDCCLNDLEMLFTMPNKFESIVGLIRAQNNWNREMGKLRQHDEDMHQNMYTIYFPDPSLSKAGQQNMKLAAKIQLNEFIGEFEALQIRLNNTGALHWQKTLSQTLDLLTMTEVYLRCVAYHQSSWSSMLGASFVASLQECQQKLLHDRGMINESEHMKRVIGRAFEAAKYSNPSKHVTQQTLDRLGESRQTWNRLRGKIKDATCVWAQGVEDAFRRLAGSSAATGAVVSQLTMLVGVFTSLMLIYNY